MRIRASLATLLACLGAALALAAPAGAAELPSCAEGPERVGDTILGTPCNDRIVAPPTVSTVDAGPGNDVILGANSAAVPHSSGEAATGLHLEVGSQTFNGGPGNDIVYGDRGNDTLRGGPGNDRLYGGIGDDVLEGGEGDDLLSGGFGTDKIDGQEGSDFVRGDATVDHIFDTGLVGFDTLSFATGVTPGFTAANPGTGVTNFPGTAAGEERGIFLKLGEGGSNAIDGEPSLGGGNDEVQPGAFERIVGTPFSDYIVGSSASEQIYGGGGADVIKGEGGNDLLNGGADGDYLDGGEGTNTIEAGPGDNCVNPTVSGCGSAKTLGLRSRSAISVGETTAGETAVYVVGSEAGDTIGVSVEGANVKIEAPGATFNSDAGGCSVSGTTANCPIVGLLDSVLVAGKGGGDTISANVPDGVGVVELGGEGSDTLNGSASEDVLVDGEGAATDTLHGNYGDDALTHNGGADLLDGGEGSDLFLSVSICDGETISGGIERVGAATPDRDNASWARFAGEGVDARLDLGTVGRIGAGELPTCGGEELDHLVGIEDLEASNQDDVLYGNEGENQLLGHKGSDTYFALGGNDSILANGGFADRVINCGPGNLDQAVIDERTVAIDPTPIECERVREGRPGEFEELPLLTEPPPPAPPLPPPDRTPPKTKLLRHPGKTLRVAAGKRKLVAFRFAANEKGSRFQCRLDRKRYASCKSPRKYRVGVGRHAFAVVAIDAAGNRDKTPSVFRFKVIAVKRHVAKAHGPKRAAR